MQFETLKKSHKKEIIIGALAICVIGGSLTFATTRAKYKLTESIPLVSGEINYKPYDFKIMAMYQSEDGTNYTEVETMPSTGYVINESKSYCEDINKVKDTTAVLKTIDGNHTIGKLKYNDRCYLYFDIKKITIPEIIAAVNPKDTTPDFSQIATTDEGVFKAADGMYGGTSYYWRGAVTNNYVKFADKCWRIVRINGDGSIRLIYDGTTCHANGANSESIAVASTAYNTSRNQPYYVGWTYGTGQRPSPSTGGTASNAKTQTEKWFDANITGANLTKVDTSAKYCNDRDAQAGSSYGSRIFYYAAYKRIITDHIPSLACNASDRYTLKVGLITADEVMYAGGTDKDSSSYYLYNGQKYWTMSPSWWNSSSDIYVFYVRGSDGGVGSAIVSNTFGLRPVINLKSDITFSSGDGTLNSPYIVSQ